MKKPLLLQHHFPFLPRPSFFPGHRILPRSQQKHHPIVPPGLLGLVVFHSTVPSLYKASYGCILSGNASSFQEGLWFSCVPGLLLGLLCPPSASAASTNLILRWWWGGTPREGMEEKDLTSGILIYNRETSLFWDPATEYPRSWWTSRLQQWTWPRSFSFSTFQENMTTT